MVFVNEAAEFPPPSAQLALTTDAANNPCPFGYLWVFNYFGECVDTPKHFVGFLFGYTSLFLWFIPLCPQLYENYKRGDCDESISMYFLFCWLMGDSLNLTGAILTHQLPTQIYVAFYYIFQDLVMLGQFLYYKNKKSRTFVLLRSGSMSPTTLRSRMKLMCFLCTVSVTYLTTQKLLSLALIVDPYASGTVQGRRLFQFFVSPADKFGYILGWLSSLFYVISRFPQLHTNYKRKNTVGLSVAMFFILVFANLTYALQIILAGEGVDYWLRHLPWFAGAFGCSIIDGAVVLQIFYYTRPRINVTDEMTTSEADSLLQSHSRAQLADDFV